MGLVGSVGDLPGIDPKPPGVAGIVGLFAITGGQQRAQCRARSGVLDDPAAVTAGMECGGQVEHLDQPVEDVLFEFGAGWAGGPEHALDTEPSSKQFTEDRGGRRVGRKVSEEVGGLPVSDSRQDDPADIFQDLVKCFALDRW